MQGINRKQFLQGQWRGDAPIRPPWSVVEDEFVAACTNCGDCLLACPEQIIEWGRGRYPIIDFKRGECTFCGDCLNACQSAALNVAVEPAFAFHIDINESCLAQHGVECRSCGDHCDVEAITFKPAVGGIARPSVDFGACTGCGACIHTCPVGAVHVANTSTTPVPRERHSL